MTIAQEAPMHAACRLAAGALRNGFKFEALHVYADRKANPLYWRIRVKHPATGKKWIRPMRLAGGRYELYEPGRLANGKPLYRLHELAARPNDVVIVTEGKYKADQLAALGLLVTTSGAADSAGEADWPARTRVTSVPCRRSPAVAQVRAEVRACILRTFAGRGLIERLEAREMLAFKHSRFSVNAGVRIVAQDRAGLERLLRYCARPPFALGRLRQRGAGTTGCWHCARRSELW